MASGQEKSSNPSDERVHRGGDPAEVQQENLTDSSSGDSSSEDDDLPLRPGEEQRLRAILAQQESLRRELTARLAEVELNVKFQKLRSLLPGTNNRSDRACTLAEARELIRTLEDILNGMVQVTGVPVNNNTAVGVPAFKRAAVGVPVGDVPLIFPQGIPLHLQYPQFPNIEGVTHATPLVEVTRTRARKLKLKIACINRRGLLADLLKAIQSVDLSTREGIYLRCDPHMLVDVELEKGHPSMELGSTSEPGPQPPSQPLREENEEDDLLRELLLRVIRRDPANPDNNGGSSNGKST